MNPERQSLNFKKWLIIIATLITAGIHFSLNFSMGKFDPLFTLNGFGYLTLLVLYIFTPKFLLKYKNLIRIAYLSFALLTIILWVILGKPYTITGYIDKTVEMLLVVLLLIDKPNRYKQME